jgi:hypothetical protein
MDKPPSLRVASTSAYPLQYCAHTIDAPYLHYEPKIDVISSPCDHGAPRANPRFDHLGVPLVDWTVDSMQVIALNRRVIIVGSREEWDDPRMPAMNRNMRPIRNEVS